MKSKLLLLGGVSCSGKTAVCERMGELYGIPNQRLHDHVLRLGIGRSIDYIIENWNEFTPQAMRAIIEEAKRAGILTLNKHFSVQPKLDTAYALGREFDEEIEEPYIMGLEGEVLRLPEYADIDLYMFLIDSDPQSVL